MGYPQGGNSEDCWGCEEAVTPAAIPGGSREAGSGQKGIFYLGIKICLAICTMILGEHGRILFLPLVYLSPPILILSLGMMLCVNGVYGCE